MLHSDTENLNNLPLSVHKEVDAICTRFEVSWKHQPCQLEEHWSPREGPKGDLLFRELLLVELECRKSVGLIPSKEEYLTRFPEMAGLIDWVWQSINGPGNSESSLTRDRRNSSSESAKATISPRIDGYTILKQLGQGGMGTVYKARQLSLGRLVALKVMRHDLAGSPRRYQRFRAEADAVARLQHPNIVQIYEVGECEQSAYLALEYVEGNNLAEMLNGTPIKAQQAARLLREIALAIDAAHKQGIIHRDLKPANILLPNAGQPDDAVNLADTEEQMKSETPPVKRSGANSATFPAGENSTLVTYYLNALKIADFGLAKQVYKEDLTNTGEILGTPKYMAPEQAQGHRDKMGPAVDIYAMGAILYELLTGRTPFAGATAMDTMHQLVHSDPVPPSRLSSRLPRDVETICLRCLEKDPKRRYPNAAALASDLGCFLDGKSTTARPAGPAERAIKWIKRRPASAALIAVTATALFVVLIGSWLFTWQFQAKAAEYLSEKDRATEAEINAKQAEADAKRSEKKAKDAEMFAKQETSKVAKQKRIADVNRYTFQIQLAEREIDAGNFARAEQLLLTSAKHLRDWEFDFLWARCRRSLSEKIPGEEIVALGPAGKFLVVTVGQSVQVWNHQTRKVVFTSKAPPVRGVTGAWFSPDGKWLKLAMSQSTECIELDLTKGKEIRANRVQLELRGRPDSKFIFSRDGTLLSGINKNRTLFVLDVATGALLWNKRIVGMHRTIDPVFTPDSKSVITASKNEGIYVLNARTGEKLRVIENTNNAQIARLSLNSNGKHLLVEKGTTRGYVNTYSNFAVIDFNTGKQVFNRMISGGHIGSDFIHPSRPTVAIPGRLGLQIRNYQSNTKVRRVEPHLTPVKTLVVNASGSHLATAGHDNGLRICRLDVREALRLKNMDDADFTWDLSPDGGLVAVRHADFGFKVYSTDTWKELFAYSTFETTKMLCSFPSFSPDGAYLAASFATTKNPSSGKIIVWKVSDWEEKLALPTTTRTRVHFTKKKNELLVLQLSRKNPVLRVLDIATQQWIHSRPLQSGEHSGLQERQYGLHNVIVKKTEKSAELYDRVSGKRIAKIATKGRPFCFALSFDKQLLAVFERPGNNNRGEVIVLETKTGKEKIRLTVDEKVSDVKFSPKGERLVIAHQNLSKKTGAVTFWDIHTKQQILTFPTTAWMITFLQFSDDGRVLSACGLEEILFVWDSKVR